MKVKKTYGVVADRGSQAIKFCLTDEGLALVGYKDGMAIRNFVYTEDEFKKIRDILVDYLGIKEESKTESNSEKDEVVSWLVSTPAGDTNFKSTLEKATAEQLDEAIKQVKAKGGRNKTKLTVLEGQKDRLKPKTKADSEPEKKEEEDKVIPFPEEDKKPVIIPLKTDGNATYGECFAKLKKETEIYSDADNEYVITGLLELLKVDGDFRNNFMREDKSYKGFEMYMFKAAQSGYCGRYGMVGWLDKDRALGIAIDYYNHNEEEEKRLAEEEAAKRKAEAEKKKKEAKANGKTNSKKKNKTA